MDDMSSHPLIPEVHSIQAPRQPPNRERKKKKPDHEQESDKIAPINPTQPETLEEEIIPSPEEDGKGCNVDIQV